MACNVSSRFLKIFAVAEGRQKNVDQDWKEGSQAPGERVYLDIETNVMVILASGSL
jgi:hypothetical protein